MLTVTFLATISLSGQEATEPLELAPHHAAASVGDLDRAVKWYREKLGFKLILRQKLSPDREIAWMTIPGYRIDLIQMKGSVKRPETKDHMLVQGWGHIVFSVPNVDRAHAILVKRGVVLPEPAATNEALHIRTFHFPDSEGNWLEFYQDVNGRK